MLPNPIKVLCVEDNALVGGAMGRKLQGNPDFQWLGWVSTSAELFQKVAETPPDVICMDLDIPGENAFEMIEQLRTRSPQSRVMILSGHFSQKLVDESEIAGAWGYLSKAEESRLIIDSIKRIASGATVFGRTSDVAKRVTPNQSPLPEIKNPVPPPATKRPFSFLRFFRKSGVEQ